MPQKSKIFYIAQLALASLLLLSRATASIGGVLGRYTDVLFLLLIVLSVYGLSRKVSFARLPLAVRLIDITVLAILGSYGAVVVFYALLFRNFGV